MISILLPTRSRVELLHKVIHNLYETCDNEENYEILIKVDDDDIDTVEYLEEYYKDHEGIRWIVTSCGRGYPDMHKWINDLCEIAKGQLLFLYNDDCVMETKGWDTKMLKYKNKVAVLKTNTKDQFRESNLFPVLNKKIYDLWGHFSLSPHNDTWVELISRAGKFEIPIDVEITHDRADITGNNEDVIFLKRSKAYHTTLPEFWNDEMKMLRVKDAQVIMDYIAENGNEIN